MTAILPLIVDGGEVLAFFHVAHPQFDVDALRVGGAEIVEVAPVDPLADDDGVVTAGGFAVGGEE
jgi:hypothetical protein